MKFEEARFLFRSPMLGREAFVSVVRAPMGPQRSEEHDEMERLVNGLSWHGPPSSDSFIRKEPDLAMYELFVKLTTMHDIPPLMVRRAFEAVDEWSALWPSIDGDAGQYEEQS